jgi:hypothetical protein
MTTPTRREMFQLLAGLAAAPAFSRGGSELDDEPVYDDGEAYRVYSTLIPKDWVWTTANAESLVIAELTVSPKSCLSPEGDSAVILNPAIENYKSLTTKRWRMTAQLKLSKPYTLVSKRELDAYFSKGVDGWREFYAKY